MKKLIKNFIIKGCIICIIFTSVITVVSEAQSAGDSSLDPRVKVILTMAGYGVVGGALLGAASMAYGTKMRAIAMGASLGLYAGLIFGGYVLASHYYNKQAEAPSSSSPYQDSESTAMRSELIMEENWQHTGNNRSFRASSSGPNISQQNLFFLNLFQYRF